MKGSVLQMLKIMEDAGHGWECNYESPQHKGYIECLTCNVSFETTMNEDQEVTIIFDIEGFVVLESNDMHEIDKFFEKNRRK